MIDYVLEEEDDAIECSGTGCDELVYPDDPYYSSPCGTFCTECMDAHALECGVCRSEFDITIGDDEYA